MTNGTTELDELIQKALRLGITNISELCKDDIPCIKEQIRRQLISIYRRWKDNQDTKQLTINELVQIGDEFNKEYEQEKEEENRKIVNKVNNEMKKNERSPKPK